MLQANVIGATGLVGKQLIKQLIENDQFKKIRIFVRRDSGIEHEKIEQHIIDFKDQSTWEKHLSGDVLFSALGSTLKEAGSKEKEYEIDYTFNFDFATVAKRNGIKNYVLVSSIGANSKSQFFYTRMKGDLDNAVSELKFDNLVIIRPAALTGIRDKKRLIEDIFIPVTSFFTKLFLKKYRPIEGSIVAKAMINGVLQANKTKNIWEADEVFELGS